MGCMYVKIMRIKFIFVNFLMEFDDFEQFDKGYFMVFIQIFMCNEWEVSDNNVIFFIWQI